VTRTLEADYEQAKTLLMALRNIRDRINPESLLPYITPEGRAMLDRRSAPHRLGRTILAWERALGDMEAAIRADAEADDAACAASAVA
jgi:hypothetical protein